MKGYDAWRTRTPWDDEPDHMDDCPAGPDGPEIYSECGGVGRCECTHRGVQQGFFGWLRMWFVAGMWWAGPCAIVADPDCTCPSPEEIAADRAEARVEACEDS